MLKSVSFLHKTNFSRQFQRYLSIHEYQSLKLFDSFGVGTPKTTYVTQVNKVLAESTALVGSSSPVVIKAQVLAGGRGKGYFKENGFQGGVHVCSSPEEAQKKAEQMIGQTLITKQTGETGKPCNGVLLSEKFNVKSEKYFAILMDRASGGPVLVGSAFGGMSIEEVAEEHPDAICKIPVNIQQGITNEQALEMAKKIGFNQSEDILNQAVENIKKLYQVFIEKDCTLIEINPLIETDDNRVIVCDAKLNFDDNAFFRQKDVFDQRDSTQEDSREVEAAKWDLNYIGLDGNIACMVNGAGLAMATMDLLSLVGGSPANFLDVGGSASVDQVKAAFKILQDDQNVKSILVNIFGGIMRCDVIAEGIVTASRELALDKPIIIRLVGTNVERGKEIIQESGLNVYAMDDLTEAAKKAVELS